MCLNVEVTDDTERRFAEPVKYIKERDTGVIVGYLYRWNTGELVPMWKNGARKDVIYD